jgi:hypothetical protein
MWALSRPEISVYKVYDCPGHAGVLRGHGCKGFLPRFMHRVRQLGKRLRGRHLLGKPRGPNRPPRPPGGGRNYDSL